MKEVINFGIGANGVSFGAKSCPDGDKVALVVIYNETDEHVVAYFNDEKSARRLEDAFNKIFGEPCKDEECEEDGED